MHPFLPFAALPVTVIAAWFGASHLTAGDPGRFQVTQATEIEDPSALMETRSEPAKKADIHVKAFLPHVPPRPPAPEPVLILHSVMTGAGIRLADINGQIVREGDQVQGYQVKRISMDSVVLALGDKTRSLPMRPLHELPPPVTPEQKALQDEVAAKGSKTDLTQDFWKIFDSLKL